MQLKKIPIKNGNELEVRLTEEFLVRVRESMSLPPGCDVADEQIVDFIHQAFKNALDKESENGQQ